MAVKVDIDKAISAYEGLGGNIKFKDDAKKVLSYVGSDKKITSISDLAYLLATAEIESGYSLSRWESDFVCRDASGGNMTGRSYVGVLPNDMPCQSALNYYASTSGKRNYYDLGVDHRGLPYFGRGLIQLTGRENYLNYGKAIGLYDRLLRNPELILTDPKISYEIAVEFLSKKRGGIYAKFSTHRSTFDMVKDQDFNLARRSVNGCTNCSNDVEKAYLKWMQVLNMPKMASLKTSLNLSKKQKRNILGYALVGASFIGLAILFYKVTRPK